MKKQKLPQVPSRKGLAMLRMTVHITKALQWPVLGCLLSIILGHRKPFTLYRILIVQR